MDVIADLEFRRRAILVEETLVVADLHVGRGENGGYELPIGDGADLLRRLEDLLAATNPERLVIAGDLLHSFSTIPRTVRDTVDGIRAAAEDAGVEIVVTPGNHDTMLESVWDGETRPAVRIGETVVCHGHEEPPIDGERYVVGHDHPTIEIEGRRRPCFLAGDGRYRGADVVMVPAFNRLLRGVGVGGLTGADLQSPLCRPVEAFAPIVVDESDGEALTFPPLGEFRHRL